MTHFIQTTDALVAFCAAARTTDFLAVDTEFIREKTYWSTLCLVQVASDTGVAVIDALAPDIDLTPLWELLYTPSIIKVFHAARQDVEIFVRLKGVVPAPLVDTQIAAGLCGFRDQMGYDKLVKVLTGADIDKSFQHSDWSRRPLSAGHLHYAASDVIHLRAVYQQLMATLEHKKRATWLEEDMAGLEDVALYQPQPVDAWQRLRLPPATKPEVVHAARALAFFREEYAQRANLPRGHVLSDEVLMKLAVNRSGKKAFWQKILKDEHRAPVADIIALLENLPPCPVDMQATTMAVMDTTLCTPSPTSVVADLLKVLLKQRAAKAGVPEKMVANSEQLEMLAKEGAAANSNALKGWRLQVFGQEALQLLEGGLSLFVERGGVQTQGR